MKRTLLTILLVPAVIAGYSQLSASGGSWTPIGDTQLFMSCDDSLGGDGDNDGGLYVNGLSEVVGQGVSYEFGGTAVISETINIVTNTFNSVLSFVQFDIEIYNVTDGIILASTNELVLAGTPTVNSVLSYSAVSSDVGDVIALRFVRTDDGNDARDFIIDNATLNSNPIPVCTGEDIAINTNTTVTDLTISANYSCGEYQWVDCSDNSPIAGETNQSFTATEDGDYAVVIFEGDCSDTSECVTITHFGLDSYGRDFKIYPNPVQDILTIEIGPDLDVSKIEVVDLSGKPALIQTKPTEVSTLHLAQLATGVYFVKIYEGRSMFTQRIVKR